MGRPCGIGRLKFVSITNKSPGWLTRSEAARCRSLPSDLAVSGQLCEVTRQPPRLVHGKHGVRIIIVLAGIEVASDCLLASMTLNPPAGAGSFHGGGKRRLAIVGREPKGGEPATSPICVLDALLACWHQDLDFCQRVATENANAIYRPTRLARRPVRRLRIDTANMTYSASNIDVQRELDANALHVAGGCFGN